MAARLACTKNKLNAEQAKIADAMVVAIAARSSDTGSEKELNIKGCRSQISGIKY